MPRLGLRLPPMMAAFLVVFPACADDTGGDGDGAADAATGADPLACVQGPWACTLPDSSTAEMDIDGMSVTGMFTQAMVSATIESTFTFDGSSVTIVDTGGSGACPADQMGEYTYTCDASSLSFDLVSDDCMGRMMFLGCDWTKG
ncbi:MAG: hypothetical protein AAF721_21680 [Myxococcota bacterium]